MTAPAGLSRWLVTDDPALGRPAALRMLPDSLPDRLPPAQAPVACWPASRWPGGPTYLVVAAVVTLAAICCLGWLGQTANVRIPAETAVVRVGAGETLWDVAQRVAPESDPRAVVERIRRLNGTVGSAVQPGQQLRVSEGR